MKLIKRYSCFFILILFMGCYNTQAQSPQVIEKVELDSTITHGRLANGLIYFIKPLKDSLSTLHLELYNKVGANQEDHDQLGVAHTLEHLAFKSSKLYPMGIRNSGIREKLGMSMYDYSGSSGRKSTIYSFDVPTGNQEALNEGLLWFKDILNGLHLNEKDISSAKGEVRQEALMKETTKRPLYSGIFPCEESDIDYLEDLETQSPEVYQRFYKDWYRPEFMGISVVGNITNPNEIASLIEKYFSEIENSDEPRILCDCDEAYYKKPPKFSILQRRENSMNLTTNNDVAFFSFYRDPATSETLNTMEGIQKLIKMQLLVEALKTRLKEATNKYNSYEFNVQNLYIQSNFPPTLEISIIDNRGMEKSALQQSIATLKQLETFGVLREEWNTIKQRELQNLNAYNESNPQYWKNEIKKLFNYGEGLPTGKLDKLKEWLEGFTQEEFNKYISAFLSKTPEDFGIIAPAGHKALEYTHEDIRDWIQEYYLDEVKPYKMPVILTDVMTERQLQRLQQNENFELQIGNSGSTEILFKNGVKVALKPKRTTNTINGSIHLHGFSLRGANNFPIEARASALNAGSIVLNSGINRMDKFQIKRFLKNSKMPHGYIHPYIDFNETGIQGSGNAENLEALLQLVYLYFTNPRKDKSSFEDWKRGRTKIHQRSSNKLTDTDNRNIISKMTGDNSLFRLGGIPVFTGTESYKSIKHTNLETAYSIYEELFGNAHEFTFIINGDFEVQEIIPLIQKYLGSLPNKRAKTNSLGAKLRAFNPLPQGPVYISYSPPGDYITKKKVYNTRYFTETDNPGNWREHLKIQFLSLIATHMSWSLRFEKGYSLYHIKVDGYFDASMNRYVLGSTFNSLPEELTFIRKDFKEIISKIKCGDIPKDVFNEAISRMTYLYADRQVNFPTRIQKKLYEHYRFGLPWVDPKVVKHFINDLTLDDVTESAHTYFKEQNLYEFVMLNNE